MFEKSFTSLVGAWPGREFVRTPFNRSDPPCADTMSDTQMREAMRQLSAELEQAQQRLIKSDAALLTAAAAAILRERSIAVLVHDLRNSLQSVSFGTEYLKFGASDAPAKGAITRIERSCERMTELIQNVLDFAHGRLSSGIPVELKSDDALADELRHVVAEVQSAHPERRIEVELHIAKPVVCDRHRIAQLFGNLLSNAVTHGAAEQPIRLRIIADEATFEIDVSNGGKGIHAARIGGLFEPFSHSALESDGDGLGLGLFIAAEIARAHHGTLAVLSDAQCTRFTFRMPRVEDALLA